MNPLIGRAWGHCENSAGTEKMCNDLQCSAIKEWFLVVVLEINVYLYSDNLFTVSEYFDFRVSSNMNRVGTTCIMQLFYNVHAVVVL